jgi:glyoxylase-like metal-dependent hydrolase (beta-lactamase superfamily II)
MDALVALAPDVWQLPLQPRSGLNAYLVGDVVVDAGWPWSLGRLLAALDGRRVRAHVLTHAHPDHQGASAALCAARRVPLWCGAADRVVAETAAFAEPWRGPRRRLFQLAERIGVPGRRVDRTLREGDVVAGFEVIATPGHTPGHLSLWRAADGVVILGDVVAHHPPPSLSPGLREPSARVTLDPLQNRRSIRKVAALRPALLCFGHGPPIADGERFARWAEALGPTERT